jgi:hypothetical protein
VREGRDRERGRRKRLRQRERDQHRLERDERRQRRKRLRGRWGRRHDDDHGPGGAEQRLHVLAVDREGDQGQTITLVNVSDAAHTFTVTGQGIDIETLPGKTAEVTIDLPPGTYPFVCRFHEPMGMKGTLVVRS